MEWRDRGYIMSARKHGESSVIVEALTQAHGRHFGYVKGGAASKRMRGVLIVGNLVHLRWFARLEEQLGSFQVELEEANAVHLLDDALALDGLLVLCALARSLPERQAMEKIYTQFGFMVAQLATNKNWTPHFVCFELLLLQELGYGLEDSQKQILSKFLNATENVSPAEVLEGLEIAGNFLFERVYQPRGQTLPLAREKLLQKLAAEVR